MRISDWSSDVCSSDLTFEEEASNALVFPFRMGGFTVYDDAPILANRLANGNVHVEMPVRVLGTAKFKAETRTLPDEVFTTGIELPPDKIVDVRSYEDTTGRASCRESMCTSV